MRRVGKRGKARRTGMAATKPIVEARSGGRCEALFAPDCTGVAQALHHRRRGEDTPASLLAVCHRCHVGPMGIHSRPGEARRMGLLLDSTSLWDAATQLDRLADEETP